MLLCCLFFLPGYVTTTNLSAKDWASRRLFATFDEERVFARPTYRGIRKNIAVFSSAHIHYAHTAISVAAFQFHLNYHFAACYNWLRFAQALIATTVACI